MNTVRKWAEAVLAKPVYAAMFAAACMCLPFVQWVGWGWITLVTLRQGVVYGFLVMLSAVAAMLALAGILAGAWGMAAGQVGLIIIPLWLWAIMLRRTQSLGTTVQVFTVALLGIFVAVNVLHILDIESLMAYLQHSLTQGQNLDANTQERIKVFAEQFAMSWPAALFWVYTAGLFLGRWAQTVLDNTHTFKQEFQRIRLNYWVGSIAFVFVIVSFWLSMSVELLAVFALLTSLLAIAGLSMTHYYVSFKKWSSWVLIGVYAGLLFLTIIFLPLLSIVAVVDSVIDIRKRLGLMQKT